MSEALAFLWRPFLVAACLTGIHTYFGIQVLARKVIFVDLALAQVAAPERVNDFETAQC